MNNLLNIKMNSFFAINLRNLATIFCTILFFFFVKESLAQSEQELNIDQAPVSSISEEPNTEFDEFKDFDFNVRPKEIYDPFEKVNRKIFNFNTKLDIYFLEPIATFYGKYVPRPVIKSIRNFFSNLAAPFSVVNSLFQGDGSNAMASFSSFLINSTLGIGGLFDIAGNKKIEYNSQDLGQTFARYGAETGPYLMLPFFGPSNLRDFTGTAITLSLSPLAINVANVGDDEVISDGTLATLSLVSAIDKRESLLTIIRDLRANSFDPYATSRSAYMQNRESKTK